MLVSHTSLEISTNIALSGLNFYTCTVNNILFQLDVGARCDEDFGELCGSFDHGDHL